LVIIYRLDKEKSAADSFSRESGSPTLWAISKLQFTVGAKMRRETFESPWYKR
jgi:hypothetical protein